LAELYTALYITWIIFCEPLSGFIKWNTGLARRLNQLANRSSVTVNTWTDLNSSSNRISHSSTAIGGHIETTVTALLGAILALLESSTNLRVNVGLSSRDSLL